MDESNSPKKVRQTLHQQLRGVVQKWLANECLRLQGADDSVMSEVPVRWQKHGDLILFPDSAFRHRIWSELPSQFWIDVATQLKVKRLGLMGRTQANGFRQPTVRLLLGSDGWTEHNDNHVSYCFDVTQTMFSSGNITEKMRVSKFDCTGQVVVDLYAGIGYYTLQYLVHTKASHVHACEWNPAAVTALRKGLEKNKVGNRCTVYPGDNTQAGLENIADRVNLGLLPTSKPGWSVACKALKPIGGFLHIHDCLNSKDQDRASAENSYTEQTMDEIKKTLNSVKPSIEWDVKSILLERVKSYAPHITHIVLDLDCRPQSIYSRKCMEESS